MWLISFEDVVLKISLHIKKNSLAIDIKRRKFNNKLNKIIRKNDKIN